ncbi:SMI1/KNR4 family protein [Streptomyces sp. CAU 1734]|uniref:SMI1/KNR4 family protein n=1 Tax=Streptomyces sp. CAU 1734 TaxID=3140360 RepID=UPI003261863C
MVDEPVSRRPLESERIDRRLARIHQLLTRWAALRPGDGEVWRTGSAPLTEAGTAEAEGRWGLRLPENYRRYLLEFGDAGSGLMSYAGKPFDEQGEPRSAEPFPLNAPWAGRPEEITEWEEEEGSDFFEEGPGEFYAQFDDPRVAFHDLPGDAQYADGTLTLGATRSHSLARLVLNGPWAGTVWFDSFGYDGGLIHLADETEDFHDGYTLGEFCDAQQWLPLAGLPWFPAPGEGVADPATGDFLDLTLARLDCRVRLAEAERACDRLDVAEIAEAAGRLRSPGEFGFPAGHTYGNFVPYVTGLIRDELLRAVPDRASRERIAEVAEAVSGERIPAVALIVAGRWQELIDLEVNTLPEQERSVVNPALAEVMLGIDPATPAGDTVRPSPARAGSEPWAVLDTLARIGADQRQRFLDRLPVPDADELRPLLRIAVLPVTAEALDGLLAGGVPEANRVAATVLLVRALAAIEAGDGPAAGSVEPAESAEPVELIERVCALAVAVDRIGEVFDRLNAVAGGRWADWRAAREDGRRWLGDRRTG